MKRCARFIKLIGRKKIKRDGWNSISGYFERYNDEIYDAVMTFYYQQGDPEVFWETLKTLCRKTGGRKEAEKIFRTYYSHVPYDRKKADALMEETLEIFEKQSRIDDRQLSEKEGDVLYSLIRTFRGCSFCEATRMYLTLQRYADILSDLQENTWTLEGRYVMHELIIRASRKFYPCYGDDMEKPEKSSRAIIYNVFSSLLAKYLKIERWLNYSTRVDYLSFADNCSNYP